MADRRKERAKAETGFSATQQPIFSPLTRNDGIRASHRVLVKNMRRILQKSDIEFHSFKTVYFAKLFINTC